MSSTHNLALGNFLRYKRESRGWTLDELSARSGVVASTIYRLEHGLRKPRAEVLQRLAEALEVPVTDLLTLAGVNVAVPPPKLSVYMRSEYGLPEPAVHEVEDFIEELRKRYGIAPKGGSHGKKRPD